MIQPYELVRGNARRREGKFERTVDVRRGDQLHSFDGPDAALRLFRLRRFGAKTIDECLQMRNLPLLLRVRRLLLRKHLRALALELRVVAGVDAQLAHIDMNDHTHDGIKEVAVVSDEKQRAGIADEPVFEP